MITANDNITKILYFYPIERKRQTDLAAAQSASNLNLERKEMALPLAALSPEVDVLALSSPLVAPATALFEVGAAPLTHRLVALCHRHQIARNFLQVGEMEEVECRLQADSGTRGLI